MGTILLLKSLSKTKIEKRKNEMNKKSINKNNQDKDSSKYNGTKPKICISIAISVCDKFVAEKCCYTVNLLNLRS